jgi:ATP-binding cassette subfamily B multidrug efflux pump
MNISKNKWYKLFFFRGALPIFVLVIFCLTSAAYLGSLTPNLVAQLAKNYDQLDLFKNSIFLLFINFLLVYINRVVYQLSINKYVRMLIQFARVETYSRWLRNKKSDSDKYPQGEILSRIMSDTEAIRDLITSGSFGIFIDLCFVISCLIGFISLHRFTGIFISVTEIIATLLLLWGSRLMRDVFMKLRNSQATVNRVTANVMGGFHQMYYTRNDRYSSKKSHEAFIDFLDKQNEANNLDAAYYAVAESLYPILLALVIFVFPYSGLTEAALIFAIVDLIQRSINPIKEISGKIANIQRAITGIDRISHFLDDMPINDDHYNMVNDRLKKEKLKSFNVNIPFFTYPNKGGEEFSLNDISFQGHMGELIGIVGLSGSGKSTLLNILSGSLVAIDCDVSIVLDNVSEEKIIKISDVDSYSKQVSIVSQESHIFSESLYFNITLDANPNDKKLEEFKSEWDHLVFQIPYLKNLNLLASDKLIPTQLSLGQRQLLAGVRACYLKKNIVFFDEISSALDSELELALRKCILLIQQYSLTIIVAHRVETIIQADQILVMEKGRVIQSGNHGDLISNSSVYQQFISELSHS